MRSMNEWLAAAPAAQLAHGAVGCRVSVSDMADREPRVLSDGEVIDIGGKRFRYIDTPHVPHGWDAGVMFEETTGTLVVRRPIYAGRQPPSDHRERHYRTVNRGGEFIPLHQSWRDHGRNGSQPGGA
jgi:hypothetical protein